ncbi:cytochrome C oxidase subunit II, transmembrane region [Calothrix sp. NIES-3974]|nr:cytochrome C oxidase subunit II, transmembrane region [Calothrix sp. NIES-3974]
MSYSLLPVPFSAGNFPEKFNNYFWFCSSITARLDYRSNEGKLPDEIKVTPNTLKGNIVKIPSSIWTLIIGIVLTLVSLWYGQNHGLLPIPASDEANLVDGLFNTMMTVSVGIFLIVEGVLLYCAFRYRRRPGDNSDGPSIHGNIPLEILWTAIPAIIVVGISVYSFDVYNTMGGFDPHAAHAAPIVQDMTMAPAPSHNMPSIPGTAIAATLSDRDALASNEDSSVIPAEEPADVNIKVTGLQYAFLFNYPDLGIFTGELHVPIGKTVALEMSANDVIHAFWVPEFRIKQDIIPGRETSLRFTPKTPGDYAVICAELCGPYHGAMRTHIVVEPPEAFNNWVKEQQIAQSTQKAQVIAMNPDNSSLHQTPRQYLAHHAEHLGITSETLHQLHP